MMTRSMNAALLGSTQPARWSFGPLLLLANLCLENEANMAFMCKLMCDFGAG